jgi:Resolvase, N terminal domain
LEAQQTAVRDFLNGGDWRLVAEVTEVESSKRSDRPKLAEALKLSRIHGAVLVIAKLDRLARPPPVIAGSSRNWPRSGAPHWQRALGRHLLLGPSGGNTGANKSWGK